MPKAMKIETCPYCSHFFTYANNSNYFECRLARREWEPIKDEIPQWCPLPDWKKGDGDETC
jgi:uncharacterized protein YbaR (Trm112 family)